MRVMIPINAADVLPPEELLRLMQANFDSALDARYAIANELLWGVFIFGGGDSGELERGRQRLLEELEALSGDST